MQLKFKDKTEVKTWLKIYSLFRTSYHFAEILFVWFQKEVVKEIPKALKQYLGIDGINSTPFISY